MKKKIIPALLVIAAVIIAVAGFSMQISHSLNTVKAQYSYFEDSLSVEGIVIRNEDVYTKKPETIFESSKKEGERISAGDIMGRIYGKDAPKDIINTITEINSRISELYIKEAGLKVEFDDVSEVNSRMSSVADKMSETSQSGDGQQISDYMSELYMLMENKLALSGKEGNASGELELLEARRDELESGLTKEDVISRTSGLMTYAIDGFESDLTSAIISKLNPKSLDAWLDYSPEKPADSYCKIVSNNSWYFAFNITENQLDNMKVADLAYIKTTTESIDLIPVTIYNISETMPDGRLTVTIECTRDIGSALTNRKLNLIFIKNVYEGFKIPTTAVHVKDDVVGVYALMGGIVEFRPIKIVYSGEDYVMVSNVYNYETNRIHMYDEIILTTERIKEGMLFT